MVSVTILFMIWACLACFNKELGCTKNKIPSEKTRYRNSDLVIIFCQILVEKLQGNENWLKKSKSISTKAFRFFATSAYYTTILLKTHEKWNGNTCKIRRSWMLKKKTHKFFFLKNIFGLGSSSLWKLKGVCGRGFYEY